MADDQRGLFREKSLERLSSPERLDQLLRVVDQKSWVPLLTLAAIVLVGVLWAIMGKVPIHVEGRGILVWPREVVEFQAPGGGQLVRINARVGDVVEVGTVLAEISRPELEQDLELLRAKSNQLTAFGRAVDILRLSGSPSSSGDGAADAESLRQHLRVHRDLALELRDQELDAIDDEEQKLQEQKRVAERLPELLKQRLEGQQKLSEQNILSREDRVAAEEAYLNSLARITDLEAKLRGLQTDRLEAKDSYLSRLQRIADLNFDLQEYEQQAAEVEREIARVEGLLAQEGRITSQHRGRILEISAAVGQVLATGDRMGALAISPDSPLGSVTYFTVRDGKRLKDKMPIHVTPDPVERERYGSLVGHVIEVSPQPVTLAEAKTVIGNSEIAETLIEGGYRIQVFAELERDSETGEFCWSTSQGPDTEITAGTTTTARVAVENRAPITFVLPFLKSAMGVD